MKTQIVTLAVLVLLQAGIVTSLTAQQSAHIYPNFRVNKMHKLMASSTKFSQAAHRNYFFRDLDDRKELEEWMLNPEEWNSDVEIETADPQMFLEEWMLDPAAMTTNSNEESLDSAIILQDWMLDPSKMSVETDTNVQLEAWMLNPTKW